jgi:TolB-like protein
VAVDFDHNLNKGINKLREALGDTADSPRFIETLPKRGYRFIAPVTPAQEPVPTPGPETARRSSSGSVRRTGLLWLAAALLLLVVVGAVAGLVTWRAGRQSTFGTKTMLVVLPFKNMGDSPDQEHFADGLTEEMIAQIGRLRPGRLGVIARTSAMRYKSASKRIDEIGRELGVDYVLEGGVRRTGDRGRISAQLIQVRDQTALWSATYDRTLSDLFQIQGEVASRIARSLALELLPAGTCLAAAPAHTSSDAYEAYLRGRFFWNKRTTDGLTRSLEHFRQAVDRDPSCALGHVGIADAYNLLADFGDLPPRDAEPKAKAAAERALELDPGLAEAYASLAWSTLVYDHDFGKAESRFQRALELNTGCASAHQWYGLLPQGDRPARRRAGRGAAGLQLDPLSRWMETARVTRAAFLATRAGSWSRPRPQGRRRGGSSARIRCPRPRPPSRYRSRSRSAAPSSSNRR